MSKIAIDEVESVLLQKKLDPTKVQDIVRDLERIAEEIAEERKSSSGDRQKWEYVIVLDDKDGHLKGKEIAGWVVQQHEGEDASTIISRLTNAAKSQNDASKRKRNILLNIRDIFGGLKSKFLKERKLRIKTKELTRVIVVNQ